MCPILSGKEQPALKAAGSFCFACHDNLPCFTRCCRDVNIYLTPYDIIRLRRSLKIGSGEFLSKYTRHFIAQEIHIPVVQLEMNPETLYCKLVTDEGCSVYENRPWACRMFPLDLGKKSDEYRLMAGKERCLGLNESSTWVVEDWLNSQSVQPHVVMDHAFQAVLPPPDFKPWTAVEAGLGQLLFLAYDLDRFALLLDDSRLRAIYDLDDDLLLRVREDDEALLKLAFIYIRSQIEELYQAV
jgi:uncharacterized protein